MARQAQTKSTASKKLRGVEIKPAPARGPRARPEPLQSTPIDEDLDALQHEAHGMIEDAQAPSPERSGTNIQTE